MPIRDTLRNLRTFSVIVGPSLLLDAAVGASTYSAARALLTRRRRGRARPRLRPLVVAGALLPWMYALAIRPRLLRWGATREEARRVLPGDERISKPTYQTTRAVTIHAPAGEIWRWLVQLGQGRGGYYSYDWLENLAGLDIHSVDAILPALQDLKVGDLVRGAPESAGQETAFRVEALEPERAMVLSGLGGTTWSFVLEPIDDHTTRLLARLRAGKDAAMAGKEREKGPARMPGALRTTLTLELPFFIMENKMLRGIKARAEHRV